MQFVALVTQFAQGALQAAQVNVPVRYLVAKQVTQLVAKYPEQVRQDTAQPRHTFTFR